MNKPVDVQVLNEGGGRGRCHSLLNTTHRSANSKYGAKSEQSCGKTRARSTSGAPRAWRKRQNNTTTFILTEQHFLHSLSGLFLTFFVQSFRASSTGLAKPLAWTRVIPMEPHEETGYRGVCREKSRWSYNISCFYMLFASPLSRTSETTASRCAGRRTFPGREPFPKS